jgi:integrase
VIQFYKNGKRVREATGTTDWAEAAKKLRARLTEIDRNEYVPCSGRATKIKELYESFLLLKAINRSGRARELPGRWKHLETAFGWMPAANLTTDDVRRYVEARQKNGAANATINRELATLKRMFKLGMQTTPPKVLRVPFIPLLKEAKPRQGFIEDTDFARLVAKAADLWMHTFLELAYTYGWRRSELLGLRVRQVSFSARTIRLDPGTTKNLDGREVGMTARVEQLLRAAVAKKKPDDFVLTRKNGKPISDFRDAWQTLCIHAGVGSFVCGKCGELCPRPKCQNCSARRRKYQGLIPHDLRRSAAKALRAAGVPESVVMAMGGWKTAAMFRRYAIVSNADQRAAIDAIERARLQSSDHTALKSQEFGGKVAGSLMGKVQ